MKIKEVIERIKNHYKGTDIKGELIKEETTRDRILYGNPNRECKGIAVTCFASIDVIKEAIEKDVNLIICHEALFWNRGDKTNWLEENSVFNEKTKLMDEAGIVVWRNHDYIHSGMPIGNGKYTDGIFYGVMNELGWFDYLDSNLEKPMKFKIPKCSGKDLALHVRDSLGIDGVRLIGNPESNVEVVMIAGHIMGDIDSQRISQMETENIDAYIALELTDYTLSEYVRDASQLGRNKVIISPGHFNLEEIGMKTVLDILPEVFEEEIPGYYIQSGDSYFHF